MIPRQLTFSTYPFVAIAALLSWWIVFTTTALHDAHLRLFDASRELQEALEHIGYAEGNFSACKAQLDVSEVILTQTLAWQGRLRLEMETLSRACVGPQLAGGEW